MPVEYKPLFIESITEGIENGTWMHEDTSLAAGVISRAYTSDLGILRLRVKDLHRSTKILKDKGFTVRQRTNVVEVVQKGPHDFCDIMNLFKEHDIYSEPTAIIPGIYQG
jgi:hypothetical protein